MNKYITEFIGTFFLVFAAALASGELAVLAIASALMVMIYAGGHISGAHYNPAVTVAMYIRRKILSSEMPGYFAAQFLGAAVAALLAAYVFGMEGGMANDCNNSLGNGVLKTFL